MNKVSLSSNITHVMKVINAIMGLRVKEVEEEVGLDITEQGETAYGEDWGV